MIQIFTKKALFLIFTNFIVSVLCLSDNPNQEKEIRNTGEDTIMYKESMPKITDEIIFIFNTYKKAQIRVELYNEEDEIGEGTFKIANNSLTLFEDKINRGKGYIKIYNLKSIGKNQKIRISYRYPKRHIVLIKISFLEAKFLKLQYNETSPFLINILAFNPDEYFLNLSLSNLPQNSYYYIKLTKESDFRVDETSCLYEDGLEKLNSQEIIDKFNSVGKFCDRNGDNAIIIIKNYKVNNINSFIRLRISPNEGIGKVNLVLNLFKEDIFSFDNSVKYFKKISKYEGIYFTLNLTKLGNNNNYLMYSNVTKSMNVYGFTRIEKDGYDFDQSNNGYYFNYEKALQIYSSTIESQNFDYIVFASKNLYEDFSFFLFKINNSEASLVVSSFSTEKPEKVTVRSFLDENETPIRYIIVNNNDAPKRKEENYFYFFEELIGSIKAKIFDLDKNLELKENDNIYDPQIRKKKNLHKDFYLQILYNQNFVIL